MLRKMSELEIKPDNPFENDALKRQDSVERLTKLVESTEQPFVLSLEAPWGWGKTTFIRMWEAYLVSKGHVCLRFNAWENDFIDDPLVAFLGEMRKCVDEQFKDLKEGDPLKASWEEVKRIGGGVLRKTLPLAIELATYGFLKQEKVKELAEVLSEKSEKIAEFASSIAKERLEKYETERAGIQGFRQNLERLAEEVATKHGKTTPLVFFVDELDRCRPDFAIALLERIKHLFSVKRIVFVLSVDREQLNQSVKSIYGIEAQPDGYLRRFIDLTYQLPAPTGEHFCATLARRFNLDEVIRDANGFISLYRSFSSYAHVLGLSLRVQEQCFTQMNIVVRMMQGEHANHSALAFLAAIQAYQPSVFLDLRNGRANIDTVLGWIAKLDIRERLFAEAVLVAGFLKQEEANRRLAPHTSQSASIDSARFVQTANILIRSDAVRPLLYHLELSASFY